MANREHPARHIPVKLGDFSVIDTEFANIRERFDDEMTKMDDEMFKFRRELLNRECKNVFKSTTSRHHTSSSEHRSTNWTKDASDKAETLSSEQPKRSSKSHAFTSSTTQQSSQDTSLSPQQDDKAWWADLNSPIIQDEGDNKKVKLRFDLSQYTPEEIVVKIMANTLMVMAKHSEKTPEQTIWREYSREFLLPKGTDHETVKSSLSKDGVLTVEAALPAVTFGEKLIPIAHK